ncbi:MAG: hypothetical protein C5B49_14955 [Bdellovibrio sp.]|nr:MAG: hypothetical protein C5B49_14955 [Bdellovibrio sp.]
MAQLCQSSPSGTSQENRDILAPAGSAVANSAVFFKEAFMSRVLLAIFLILFTTPRAFTLSSEEFAKPPRLVVVLVIDQFRSDYLTRFEKKFLPAGTAKNPGGFRFLMKESAYFPFAEYDSFQNMTCPGHATIATGSRPVHFGFSTNAWYDDQTQKTSDCTEDSVYGQSPHFLRTTTFGDELRLISPLSKVFSVALKARAAIMLGGHRANLALWLKDGQITTSDFYQKGKVPDWVTRLNEELKKQTNTSEADLVGSVRDTQLTFRMATKILETERLGRGADPDVLLISLSSHDLLGHARGPNHRDMMDLTLAEDKALAQFLKFLTKHMDGLSGVTIAVTGDHGIPPAEEELRSTGPAAGDLDMNSILAQANRKLDEKFGAPGKSPWILAAEGFHIHLNHPLMHAKKISPADVENEIRQVLLRSEGVADVFTRSDAEARRFPPGFLGEQVKNSYVADKDGDVLIIPRPFISAKGPHVVNHITGYSYDRSVPLLIFGPHIKPGVYSGAKVIDLAPTLSFMLRTIPPATCEGKVRQEIFK